MLKLFKRILCCAMVAAICITMFSLGASAQATPKLTISSVNGALAGQTIEVNIKAENFDAIFGNMIVIELDGLTAVSVLRDGALLTPEADYYVVDGKLRYVGTGEIDKNNVTPDLTNKNNALTLKVKIPNEPKSAYQLSFVDQADASDFFCEFVDKDNANVNVQLIDGNISISAVKNGWIPSGGKWYFFENGNMVKKDWRKDSVGWVYLGEDGAMLTNEWCTDSQGWCYVGADGYAVTNCWKKDSIGWIWLNANGSMTKSKWIKDGGKWYYLNAKGYMMANEWMKDSVGWVFLGSDGAMKTNAWVRDSIGWCYVGSSGYAVTNCWKKDSVGWCYLNSNGSMTKNAWVKDGGKWYYLNSNGYMVTNTSIKIGGKIYKFNASGVCTNP